ncbi:MAG: YlxR family protein [Chloroflexi bacterium]|nr:YlxR family protein [Chloroflexota bacterium]
MVNQAAAPQGKHIPQRTCLGCRTTKPKQALARIVRTADGRVAVDTTGKARGRGAYLCPNAGCARRALKAGTLKRALRVAIDDAALAELRAWAEQFAETAPTPAQAP